MSDTSFKDRTEALRTEIFGTPSPNGLSPPTLTNSVVTTEPAAPEYPHEQTCLEQMHAKPEQELKPNKVLGPFDMVDQADALKKQQVEAFCVLYLLAQKGRWTVIYAPPNLGKTLLVFALLARTLEKFPALAKCVYYINADDNIDGVIEKASIAADWGFYMLVPGYKGFNIRELQQLIREVCKSGLAHQTIIIIDTLKKAVDLMKKSHLRAFGECLRLFVSLGGTVITLAHTNKNLGPDGKPIPEGTSDILNDADCAYVAYEVDRDSHTKTVMLECRKTRGGDPQEVFVQYSVEPDLSYQQLLSTVEIVDGDALQEFKPVPQPTAENLIVAAIRQSITAGINTKMRIRDFASDQSGASKREVLRIIELYTGNDPEMHKWNFTRGERGRQQFQLLTTHEPRDSDSADFQNSAQIENSAAANPIDGLNPFYGD